MKRNLFMGIFSLVFLVISGYGLHVGDDSHIVLSDLALANVEALASGETGGQKLDCWETVSSKGNVLSTHVTYCGDCKATLAKSWSNKSMCNN